MQLNAVNKYSIWVCIVSLLDLTKSRRFIWWK